MFCFISVFSFSDDLSFQFALWDLGMSFENANHYFTISGPEFTLRSLRTDIGLTFNSINSRIELDSIDIKSLTVTDPSPFISSLEVYDTNICEISIFWSPFNINKYSQFGPEISTGFSLPDNEIFLTAALSFSWRVGYFTVLILSAEAGYSILDNSFYAQFSTDLFTFATLLIASFNKKIFNPVDGEEIVNPIDN